MIEIALALAVVGLIVFTTLMRVDYLRRIDELKSQMDAIAAIVKSSQFPPTEPTKKKSTRTQWGD